MDTYHGLIRSYLWALMSPVKMKIGEEGLLIYLKKSFFLDFLPLFLIYNDNVFTLCNFL
jgi:hypothetical protein